MACVYWWKGFKVNLSRLAANEKLFARKVEPDFGLGGMSMEPTGELH
jgi:hypothetical protein